MKKTSKKQRLLQKQTKQLLIFATAVTLVCLGVWYVLVQVNGPLLPPKRLVTFYDSGTSRAVLTRADTVRGALNAANIEVDPHDIVEPSAGSRLTKPYVDVVIYRSRPVEVIDGGKRQNVMTVAQSPNEILKDAGLKPLGRKDKTTFTSGNIVDNGAFVVLHVERQKLKHHKVATAFKPGPDALTPAKGAQIFVDKNGIAHRETYYDLPMNIVIKACGADGKYTIRSDGAKIDQDGYVLVAASYSSYPRCTIVDTSMGPGKVYDTGGFALRHPYGFDLATDWTNHDGQ